MSNEADSDVDILESELRDIESREYERALAATVSLDGPSGGLTISRTYEALPYHNDTVHRDGADSNDELLDRPDAVHVHTKYYRLNEDGYGDDEDENGQAAEYGQAGEGRQAAGDGYFLDRHETWRLVDPAILEHPERFWTACERHHLADLSTEYDWAMDAAARAERPRPELATPEGWTLLS